MVTEGRSTHDHVETIGHCRPAGPPLPRNPDNHSGRDSPPTCGPHDVVVAPRSAALHVADLLMMKGEYQVRPELPFVPGMEAAGLVIEVGDQVTHLARGDRVLAMMTQGAIAGAVVVPGRRSQRSRIR
ncbi:alcohol dehydrogenase catalytic domain-containing protein [Rhodococcus opacus]|nr:alcohol dehydrogenase catalytic domain-containing protein [Rhodococcus opacus]